MPDATDHEKRSRELADSLRRFLIGFNTGGIAIAFYVAGALIAQRVNPGWVTWPVAFFALGLFITAGSLLLAKYREIKRRDAATERRPIPDFTTWYWRSFTWDFVGVGFFVLGTVIGLVLFNA